MQLSGTIASGWQGQVSGFDLFDVAQLLCLSGRTRALSLRFVAASGALVFREGQLVHASAGEISGEEAFFEMVGWAGGSFENMDPFSPGDFPDNIEVPTMHLLMEAARRKDELAHDRIGGIAETPAEDSLEEATHGPSPAQPTQDLLGDDFWEDLARVQQRVAERLYEAAAPLDPAPPPPTAPEPAPSPAEETEIPPSEPDPAQVPQGWWEQMRDQWGDSVQVVVAWPGDLDWKEAGAEVSRLASALGAVAPTVSLSAKGPSFVRLHPSCGGSLSLTFLSIHRKHRFLFETLIRSAQMALIPQYDSADEASLWSALIPAGVPCVTVPGPAGDRWPLAEGLQEMGGRVP